MTEELAHFDRIARAAAVKAGQYLAEQFGTFDSSTIREKKRNDFVSAVDQEAERLIVEHLKSHFPDHQFLGEEGGHYQAKSDFCWIIDPLDGTTNFIRNIPFFCVSIALYHRQQPLVGIVNSPVTNEFFSAVFQQGAFLNGSPLSVSQQTDFARAFLATGFPHQQKRQLPTFINAFNDIFFHSGGVRRLGAAALDLCYVAAGRFDGYWELGLHAWDIAAGVLIVQEAGGMVSDFQNSDSYLKSGEIVSSNGHIHPQIIHHLSPYFRSKLS